ncbi:glutamyl-tRNA reductase [Mesobacillus foraminis]|uniref:glutamyl-tRNA reductase n=1 Tax=Mesobacillus foraminis TaxID=279826 RepID=UPI000EF54B3E|nr:glutamyl-tRNA reductase [Mesobacillus foraminis]
MHVIAIGINHKIASVQIRESFNQDLTKRHECLKSLREIKGVKECVILNTCNRFEVYVAVECIRTGMSRVQSFLSTWFGGKAQEILDLFYKKADEEAYRHLFKVTCGLDSLVLGETQILGQIKTAFFESQQSGGTSTIFNSLFKRAIVLAKRVHTETGIGHRPVSISYAATELMKKKLPAIENKTALVLGAGETGRIAAKNLAALALRDLIIVNRTYEKAECLAKECRGKAVPFERLKEAVIQTDVIISAIRTESPLLTKKVFLEVMKAKPTKELLVFDLSVPRSAEVDAASLEGVKLYDVDELQGVIDSNLVERARESRKIVQMIEDEISEYKLWLKTQSVIPLISALTNMSLSIHNEAMEHIENKLPSLSERERKIIRKYSKMPGNQLLSGLIIAMKELAASGDSIEKEQLFDIFATIFSTNMPFEKHDERIIVEESRNFLHSHLVKS